MWYVRPAKTQTSLRIRAVCSEPLLVAEYSMTVKLHTKHHLEFLRLKKGCTGLSESTLVKIAHCWKSRVTAYILTHIFQERNVSTKYNRPGFGNGSSKDTRGNFMAPPLVNVNYSVPPVRRQAKRPTGKWMPHSNGLRGYNTSTK